MEESIAKYFTLSLKIIKWDLPKNDSGDNIKNRLVHIALSIHENIKDEFI